MWQDWKHPQVKISLVVTRKSTSSIMPTSRDFVKTKKTFKSKQKDTLALTHKSEITWTTWNQIGLNQGQQSRVNTSSCLVCDKKFSFQFMFQEKHCTIRFNLSSREETLILQRIKNLAFFVKLKFWWNYFYTIFIRDICFIIIK